MALGGVAPGLSLECPGRDGCRRLVLRGKSNIRARGRAGGRATGSLLVMDEPQSMVPEEALAEPGGRVPAGGTDLGVRRMDWVMT